MLVLSTKPLQKLNGTGGQAVGQADKPVYWEAAPPKMGAGKTFEKIRIYRQFSAILDSFLIEMRFLTSGDCKG